MSEDWPKTSGLEVEEDPFDQFGRVRMGTLYEEVWTGAKTKRVESRVVEFRGIGEGHLGSCQDPQVDLSFGQCRVDGGDTLLNRLDRKGVVVPYVRRRYEGPGAHGGGSPRQRNRALHVLGAIIQAR